MFFCYTWTATRIARCTTPMSCKPPTKADLQDIMNFIQNRPLPTSKMWMNSRDYAGLVGLDGCPNCGYLPHDLVTDPKAFEDAMDVHFRSNPKCMQSHVHSV